MGEGGGRGEEEMCGVGRVARLVVLRGIGERWRGRLGIFSGFAGVR